MLSHNEIPLAKEELFPLLCNLCEQYLTAVAIINPKDEHLPILYYNQQFAELTGYDQKELINQNLSSLKGIRTDEETFTEIQYYLEKAIPFDTNIIFYNKLGYPFWININCQPIYDNQKEVKYLMLHCKNRTEEMLEKMLAKLEREVFFELDQGGDIEELMQLICEKVEKFYIRDVRCAIHIVQSRNKLKAVASGSLTLKNVKKITKLENIPIQQLQDQTLISQQIRLNELEEQTKLDMNITSFSTKPILNEDKQLLGCFTLFLCNNEELNQTDLAFLNKLSPIISLSIKYVKQKEDLKKLAYFDINTGIQNFNYFHTNLKSWIEEKKYKGYILIIQPTEYSKIVDLFGRNVGDGFIRKLIKNLHNRLHNKIDIIYGRISNSTIAIAKKYEHGKIRETINELLDLTTTPYLIAEREMFISLKIGIAHFDPSIPIDESIRQADIALTTARRQRGNVVSFFDEKMDERINRELNMLNQLNHGLKNDEFTVYLQPKVNLQNQKIEGFEALARWNSKVLGQVSPAEFIPIAEQAGKIRDIDNIILEKVLQWQQSRMKKSLEVYPVAVNISPVHFYQDSFIDDFISLIKKYKVKPEHIKIEVTESFELFDFTKAKQILNELKKYGFESSIDDFGVGFSSLSYLQKLPFSEIKIDRSFINGIHDDGMNAVVNSIIDLASKLNMHAVAEGIETNDQLLALQKMGCRTGQGYYFHKPMPISEVDKLLNNLI